MSLKVNTVYSGKEFNQLTEGKKFYKVTNKEEKT